MNTVSFKIEQEYELHYDMDKYDSDFIFKLITQNKPTNSCEYVEGKFLYGWLVNKDEIYLDCKHSTLDDFKAELREQKINEILK